MTPRYAVPLLTSVLLFLPLGVSVSAQSLTSGGLRGAVHARDGSPISGAAVTLETENGESARNLETRDDGTFEVRMLAPGGYRVLVEAVGYQPVRVRGVLVGAGLASNVSVTLDQKPPPITSVTEIEYAGSPSGSVGRVFTGDELNRFDARREATDLSRGASEVLSPADGRAGFALMGGGLPPSRSRLFVDGVPEALLRHPGVPGEPASSPAFSRGGLDQAQIPFGDLDTEWRSFVGSSLSLVSSRGTNRLQFTPFATWSGASIGKVSSQNPGDSTASSIQVGASLGTALKRDTAHVFLHGEYQSLETPTAFPWETDAASYRGSAVSLRETLAAIGSDSFATSLGSSVAPVVRTWKGGSGSAHLDWTLSAKSSVLVRGSFAGWKETSPQLGTDVGNDAGARMSGRDLSGAAMVTTVGNPLSNELRVGFSATRRDWQAAGPPHTTLIAEGVGFGGSRALPALFDSQLLTLADAAQYTKGRHTVKFGLSVDHTNYRQNYIYGSSGIYSFGDLDHFGAGSGYFFQARAANPEVSFGTTDLGLFFQDFWDVSPELQLLLGLRYQTQLVPSGKIALNSAWLETSGNRNDSLPKDRRGIQPRLGFVLDPGNRGEWIIRGGVGLFSDALDPATFAEAVLNDGDVTVRRGLGSFDTWPAVAGSTLADLGPRLTLFGGRKGYRAPRTLKADVGVARNLGGGASLKVAGSYHHTDFLLRRVDLNRSASPSGATQEGRPVYGSLSQSGGLVVSSGTSSRRFSTFELVNALVPTGFSDFYEATVSFDHRVTSGLSLLAEYTFSRTRDNMVGLLATDPADQLSPFPGGLDGADWDEGRSDLDVPHRLAATAELHGGRRTRFTAAIRARWRSGLPFTPGFRSGVDVNGDLAGGNDPIAGTDLTSPSGSGVLASCDQTTVGGFAARNTCRDKSVGAVDLRLSARLPFGAAGAALAFTVDAFNIVSSTTGIVDHAALLIDPARTVTTAANGAVTLPLVANPNFGKLLSRRGEPRLVRFGLRLEY